MKNGAFTGAIIQKVGRNGAGRSRHFCSWTEVGDIPIEIQPKLLACITKNANLERTRSTHTRRANIRLVAATNRDLEQMIAAREFRSDLLLKPALHVFSDPDTTSAGT